ncbi:ankyrin repeat [Chrysochromulina tobinii]|uniref:Ankyrin repeat n=1 Tax=Chrysochromulina tobinii TaxID=1460289 RepID=A0A0M0JX34_9EUKA|nr:ankyrin repeat [Chrysochromulina tobinii]|eukprot:KOO30698.1 ankyrin repeat [Chrysochromulina sp. CCMP291]
MALRLHTGPMYVHYSLRVLRGSVYGQYVTTIHALNSGVVKLSRLQKPRTVYRVVSGGMLPKEFFEPDSKGIMGGVELAFLSCTSDRQVAFTHERGPLDEPRPDRPLMLFQIKMGLGDAGADVEFLSQTPMEKEVVFAPRSGLEIVSQPWVEGSRVVVDLRVICHQNNRTIEDIVGGMKRAHLDVLDMMIRELRLSGAPQRALLSLTGLRNESGERGASEFDHAHAFMQATERALAAQKDVMDALGDPKQWEGEKDDDGAISARMMRTVLLQARSGEYLSAVKLLLQALQRDPLPPDLDAKITAAEKSVVDAKENAGPRTSFKVQEGSRLPEAERTPLKAAILLLSRGATQPWPAMMTTLLSSLGERATRVFGAMISTVDPGRARPSFASGAPVLVWSDAHYRWETGVVRAARGKGLYEVSSTPIEAAILPAKHVLRIAEGGAGALLYEAARSGTPQMVDALINGGVSVFECDAQANTPLHYAVRRGDATICQRLLAANADAEVRNTFGVTPWDLSLQCGHAAVRRAFSPSAADRDLAKPVEGKASMLLRAAAHGSTEEVKRALEAISGDEVIGANGRPRVDAAWSAGQTTAVMLASRRGHVEIVAALLRAGADVGLKSRSMSCALSMAAEEGYTDVVDILIEAGAELDLPDDDGFTPLGTACENGHERAARALIEASSDPNYARRNGWTHLITAAYNGYPNVVRTLTQGGANPNLAKENGYNAVIAAAYNGFDEMVATLLSLGAEADAAMSNGWNAMMVACAQGHAKVVARLCEAHAQVDYARQSNGFSALMAAASSAHGATCANILLQHRANVNLQDKRGSTALMHAAFHGRVASIEVLIQAGATPTVVRLGGFTALMDAAVGAHERVVQVLLKAQADPDAADKDGVTALMHAAKLGHDATMLPLMATSAINRKDKGGKSALDHASTPAAIKRLLDAGAEMSREFRRRKKEAEEAAKDKKKVLSGPAGTLSNSAQRR